MKRRGFLAALFSLPAAAVGGEAVAQPKAYPADYWLVCCPDNGHAICAFESEGDFRKYSSQLVPDGVCGRCGAKFLVGNKFHFRTGWRSYDVQS